MNKITIITALILALTFTTAAANHKPGGNDNSHLPVMVCHLLGNGGYILLTTDDSALEAHLGHGDMLPGEQGNCPTENAPTPIVETPVPTEVVVPTPTEPVTPEPTAPPVIETPVPTDAPPVETPIPTVPVVTPGIPTQEPPAVEPPVAPGSTEAPVPDTVPAAPAPTTVTGLPDTGSGQSDQGYGFGIGTVLALIVMAAGIARQKATAN